jgi:hypothetical protein
MNDKQIVKRNIKNKEIYYNKYFFFKIITFILKIKNYSNQKMLDSIIHLSIHDSGSIWLIY